MVSVSGNRAGLRFNLLPSASHALTLGEGMGHNLIEKPRHRNPEMPSLMMQRLDEKRLKFRLIHFRVCHSLSDGNSPRQNHIAPKNPVLPETPRDLESPCQKSSNLFTYSQPIPFQRLTPTGARISLATGIASTRRQDLIPRSLGRPQIPRYPLNTSALHPTK